MKMSWERQAVDEIIAQEESNAMAREEEVPAEIDDGTDCAETWSPNGMCPCCGCELEYHEVERNIDFDRAYVDEFYYECPICHWESSHAYDG